VPKLSEALRQRIRSEFPPDQRKEVEQALLAYDDPDDTGGVERVRHAILKGARGDLDEVRNLASAARMDYRDVLWWTDG